MRKIKIGSSTLHTVYLGSTKISNFHVGPIIIDTGSGYFYDVTTITDNSVSEPIYDTNAQDFVWHPDGNSYWIVGGTSHDLVEYSVSTQYDIDSTVTEVQSFYVGDNATTPTGIAWDDTGDNFFVSAYGTYRLYEYACSASYEVQSATLTTTSDSFGLRVFAVEFNGDGLEVTLQINGDKLRSYDLSTPYTLSSINMTYTKEFIHTGFKYSGFCWNESGRQVVMSDETSELIVSYDVGTAYDITSFSNKKTYYISGSISSGLTQVRTDINVSDIIWALDSGTADAIKEYSISLE